MALALKYCVFLYIIIFFYFKPCNGTVTANVPCPKVKAVKNFNLTAVRVFDLRTFTSLLNKNKIRLRY